MASINIIRGLVSNDLSLSNKAFTDTIGAKISEALEQTTLEVAEQFGEPEVVLSESDIDEMVDSLSEEDLQTLGEEFELQEISKATLGSYIKKSKDDLYQRSKDETQIQHDRDAHNNHHMRVARKYSNKSSSADNDIRAGIDKADAKNRRKIVNRSRGMDKAVDKLTKEEIEQVSELSKKTLSSYVKKASLKAVMAAHDAGAYLPNRGDKSAALLTKAIKRTKGITKAADKLSKD